MTTAYLKSLLFCDGVIIDAVTGKFSCIGIFDSLYVMKTPSSVPPFHIYFRVGDLRKNEVQCTVRVLAPDLQTVVKECPMPLHRGSNNDAEGAVRFFNVDVRDPNPHQVELLIDGAVVGTTAIPVHKIDVPAEN